MKLQGECVVVAVVCAGGAYCSEASETPTLRRSASPLSWPSAVSLSSRTKASIHEETDSLSACGNAWNISAPRGRPSRTSRRKARYLAEALAGAQPPWQASEVLMRLRAFEGGLGHDQVAAMGGDLCLGQAASSIFGGWFSDWW